MLFTSILRQILRSEVKSLSRKVYTIWHVTEHISAKLNLDFLNFFISKLVRNSAMDKLIPTKCKEYLLRELWVYLSTRSFQANFRAELLTHTFHTFVWRQLEQTESL